MDSSTNGTIQSGTDVASFTTASSFPNDVVTDLVNNGVPLAIDSSLSAAAVAAAAAAASSSSSSIAASEGTLESDVLEPVDGEYLQLMMLDDKLVDDDDDDEPIFDCIDASEEFAAMSVAVNNKNKPQVMNETDLRPYQSAASVYGKPVSENVALALFEDTYNSVKAGQGLEWNALIIPDTFFQSNGRLFGGLNGRDFDVDHQTIKPRRPSLPVTQQHFVSSLTRIPGSLGPRYIFSGVLNGWPSLTALELISLERQRRPGASLLPSPKELLSGQILWAKIWSAIEEGARGQDPTRLLARERTTIYRAKLRGPSWTNKGWSKASPGFAFWFEAQQMNGPRLSYGTHMVDSVESEAVCTHVHMLSHRYALPRESPRDKLTYHSVCLLEWNHAQYTTVVETAFLNGMGGYKGKSNWYDDKDEHVTALYKALPAEMVCPWIRTMAEVRCYDIPSKTLDEFKAYVEKYRGCDKRFVDPHFTLSHSARLTFRSKAHIAQYLVNYISRDSSYAELKRNCQTFTADLYSFLAGKKGIAPFHPVNRIEYQNRTYLFLYDSHLYTSTNNKSNKKWTDKSNPTTSQKLVTRSLLSVPSSRSPPR